jgi:hypothetical protein
MTAIVEAQVGRRTDDFRLRDIGKPYRFRPGFGSDRSAFDSAALRPGGREARVDRCLDG